MAPYTVIRNQHQALPGAAVLLDASGSMAVIDNPRTVHTRMEQLAGILGNVLSRVRVSRLFAYNWTVTEIELGDHVMLPEPDGGTDLAGAIEHLRYLDEPWPDQLIIISDGQPNSEEEALLQMTRLQLERPCRVHCRYCGPDDRAALGFLDRLARLGRPGSTSGKADLSMPGLVSDDIVGLITHAKS